jgi:hypothetical protein
MEAESPVPDQVLAVNVFQRWREIGEGKASEDEVVLGFWSPWVGTSRTNRHFDPNRIAVVLACKRGQTMAVYDVKADENGERWHWDTTYEPPRIVFHGSPSRRYAAQLHAPAPTWKQGEGTPLKVLGLDEILQGDVHAPANTEEPAQSYVRVGQAVVSLDGDHLTLSVPAHYTVTLTAREPHDRSN